MKLFLGLPSYGGVRYNTCALLGAMAANAKTHLLENINSMEVSGSLLAAGFNQLLCEALDQQAKGQADLMLLLHADIVPQDTTGWLATLLGVRQQIKKQHGACDVLSAVVPIKDLRGLTSTGVEGETEWSPVRLTMTQVLAMDETFTLPNLLVNTGMLLIDLRTKWIREVAFTIKDAILITPDGKRVAAVQPEDWDFSRQARGHGVTLWATRSVLLAHTGTFAYPNFVAWGSSTDLGDGHGVPKEKPIGHPAN